MLTEADKEYLSPSKQRAITILTSQYENAVYELSKGNYTQDEIYSSMNEYRSLATKIRQDHYYYEDKYDYTHGGSHSGAKRDAIQIKIASGMMKRAYARDFDITITVFGGIEGSIIKSGAKTVAKDSFEIGLQTFAKNSFPKGAPSGKELVKFFKKEGFKHIRTDGSHYIMKGPAGEVVPVPVHGNQSLPIGTLKSIKELAGY